MPVQSFDEARRLGSVGSRRCQARLLRRKGESRLGVGENPHVQAREQFHRCRRKALKVDGGRRYALLTEEMAGKLLGYRRDM